MKKKKIMNMLGQLFICKNFRKEKLKEFPYKLK